MRVLSIFILCFCFTFTACSEDSTSETASGQGTDAAAKVADAGDGGEKTTTDAVNDTAGAQKSDAKAPSDGLVKVDPSQDASAASDGGDSGDSKSPFAGVWQEVGGTYETYLRIAEDGQVHFCVFDEKSGGSFKSLDELGAKATLSEDKQTLTVSYTEKGETTTTTMKKVDDKAYPQCCKDFETDKSKMCPMKGGS